MKFLRYLLAPVGLNWASVGQEKGVSYQIVTNLFTVKILTGYFIFFQSDCTYYQLHFYLHVRLH